MSPLTTPSRDARLRGIKILVVDDDANVLEALRLLLARAGATIACASSAAAAFTAFELEPADVLLSDISMPGGDGYSLVRRLRRAALDVPAIALTAHAAVGDRDHALSSGFDLHVAKPVDLERLVTSILHVLDPGRRSKNL